jgi:hypothetical protein
MTTFILVAQGGLAGYMAAIAFGTGIEFWGALLINALLVVGYAISVSRK